MRIFFLIDHILIRRQFRWRIRLSRQQFWKKQQRWWLGRQIHWRWLGRFVLFSFLDLKKIGRDRYEREEPNPFEEENTGAEDESLPEPEKIEYERVRDDLLMK